MREDIYTSIILGKFKTENIKYIIYGTGKVADIYYDKIANETSEESIVCFIDEKMPINEYRGKKVLDRKSVV